VTPNYNPNSIPCDDRDRVHLDPRRLLPVLKPFCREIILAAFPIMCNVLKIFSDNVFEFCEQHKFLGGK